MSKRKPPAMFGKDASRYHHVYAERDWRGWEGKCEDCDFLSVDLHNTAKQALADCLRHHGVPPPVVFAHDHTREKADDRPHI